MTDHIHIADVATPLAGCAVIGLGVFSQLKPIEGMSTRSSHTNLGVTNRTIKHFILTARATGARRFGGNGVADEKLATFVPLLFARNITIGLTILLLSLQGQRKALGTLLGCLLITGLIDMRWCLKHAPGKLGTHAVGTVMFVTLGWVNWRSGAG